MTDSSSPERRWWTILQTGGAKAYWLLVTVATTVITARYLGPSGRGVVAATTSWLSMFVIFGGLSLPQVVYYLAAGREPREWVASTAGTLLTIVGCMSALGWLVAAIGYQLTGGDLFRHIDPAVLAIALAALPLAMWVEGGIAILLSLGAVHVVNRAQFIGGTVSLGLVFIFVRMFGWGISGAVVAIVTYHLFVAVVSLQYIVKRGGALRFSREVARQLISGGLKMHLNAIGSFLALQASVLIINYYQTSAATAHYQFASQMISAIQLIPATAVMLSFSWIGKVGADRAWPEHRRLLLEALGAVGAVGLIAYFAAEPAIVLVAGRAFLPAAAVFHILLLTLPGMTLSVVMASQWISRGLFLQVSAISVVIGALTVTGNYVVVPRFGIVGAAWVTVAVYILSVVINGGMVVWVERRWRQSEIALSIA